MSVGLAATPKQSPGSLAAEFFCAEHAVMEEALLAQGGEALGDLAHLVAQGCDPTAALGLVPHDMPDLGLLPQPQRDSDRFYCPYPGAHRAQSGTAASVSVTHGCACSTPAPACQHSHSQLVAPIGASGAAIAMGRAAVNSAVPSHPLARRWPLRRVQPLLCGAMAAQGPLPCAAGRSGQRCVHRKLLGSGRRGRSPCSQRRAGRSPGVTTCMCTLIAAGKERGHGTELAYCPKCNKALKPGKHHVGCSASRNAPRQTKRKVGLRAMSLAACCPGGCAISCAG